MVPFVKFAHDIELAPGSGLRPIVQGSIDLTHANAKTVSLNLQEIRTVRQDHPLEYRQGDNVAYGVPEMIKAKVPHKRYFPP